MSKSEKIFLVIAVVIFVGLIIANAVVMIHKRIEQKRFKKCWDDSRKAGIKGDSCMQVYCMPIDVIKYRKCTKCPYCAVNIHFVSKGE